MFTRMRRSLSALRQRLRVRLPLGSLRSAYHFAQLVEIVKILRSPDGCPWDQKQRHEDILPYFREEAIEALSAGHTALREPDDANIEAFAEELGDITFVSLFLARLYEEDGRFDMGDAVATTVAKMIRRHPHVFHHAPRDTDSINRNWQAIKAQERAQKETKYPPKAQDFPSILDDTVSSLSALQDALKISRKVVKVGFEWPDVSGVWAKVLEEVDELYEVLPPPDEASTSTINRPPSEAKIGDAALLQARQREELGDLLFTLVNLGRHLSIDCDEALRATCAKFTHRFQYIERQLHTQQVPIEEAGLEALEALWQEAKLQP